MNQAQLISQLRRDLDALAHEATDTVAGLLARLEDLEAQTTTPGRTPTSWCWRSIGANGADELWHLLTDWVTWIRGRHPLARKIPPCWSDHPELVEELTALWLAWQHAYEDRDAPLTAADWHDRGYLASCTGSSTGPSPSTARTATNHAPPPPTSPSRRIANGDQPEQRTSMLIDPGFPGLTYRCASQRVRSRAHIQGGPLLTAAATRMLPLKAT